MAIQVRAATVADAAAVAGIHVRGWQWGYRGLLPDDFLAAQDETLPRREAFWRGLIEGSAAGSGTRLWVAERDGQVVGFASTLPNREPDAPTDEAELTAIYLDAEAAGTGVGRALFAHASEDLRQRGFRTAILWVLAANRRARRFYEAAGWHPDGAVKIDAAHGVTLPQVRYRTTL